MSGGGSVNKVILVGRLGKDPEVHYTTDGTAVANFSLATDESFTDRAGDKQSKTEWHRIVVWKRLAEVCGEHLQKGKQVYIEGRLTTRVYEAKDGTGMRYRTEIVAGQIRLLGNRPNGKAKQAEASADIPF